jgi:hypothetical protein
MSPQSETAEAAAAIGILVLDARIERIPGDAGNPRTYPFPVRLQTVSGATIDRLIRRRDPALLTVFTAAGRELVRQGVQAITSTCGFMILFQQELAEALPVPVFTSSLLQLPFIERSLSRRSRIGILTADAGNLTGEHLRRSGGDIQRLTVCGLEHQPHFRSAILEESGRIDARKVEIEVLDRAREMLAADPAIRALLLECTNLPPYAAAIRNALGLPVYDFTTLIAHVHAALAGNFSTHSNGQTG